LQIGLGYLRNNQQYAEKRNNGKILVTIIIGAFGAYFLVAPQLGSINWDVSDPIPIITVVLTLIATVAGIDTVTKKTMNIGKHKEETKTSIEKKIADLTAKKDSMN
jgi:uncharacterized membrane protein YozB (DUF420 family)